MNYEQKYKEALERAKTKLINEVAADIFPELKESEGNKDERIRKAIRNLALSVEQERLSILNITQSDILAWLEKQGDTFTKKDVDDAYLKGVTDTKHAIERQYEANEQIRKDIATFIFNYRGDIKDRAKWIDYLGIKVSFVEMKGEQKPTETVKWSPQEESCICQLESLVKEQWRQAESVHNSVNIKKMSELMFFLKTLNPNKKPADKVEPKFKVGDTIRSSDMEEVIVCEVRDNERIRKAIGYAIGQSTHSDGTLINGVFSEEALAWLEKQGEQKPAWSEEDEARFESCIKILQTSDGYDTINTKWLKELKDRVGCEANCTTTKEWSEDDQSNFNELSSFILETYRAEDASRLLIWFKSLKERVQPDKGWIPIKGSFYTNNVVLAQKKDKSGVWEGYTVIADHTLDPLVFERYINIENISTKSLWKPSGKQMNVLKSAISELDTYDDSLVELYNDLKKLTE